MKTIAWCVFNMSGMAVLQTVRRTRRDSIAQYQKLSGDRTWPQWRRWGVRCKRVAVSIA